MANKSKSNEFKVTTGEGDINLYFKRPNVDQLQVIDLEYRRIFTLAIKQKVMAEAEARKVYKSTGAWTQNDEEDLARNADDVAKLSRLLEEDKNSSKKNGLKMVEKLAELRADLLRRISERTDLFYNTAEGLANEQRMHKFIELCCHRSNVKEKFFEGREDYRNFSVEYREVLSEIYKQAYYFEYGMPDDISDTWAEVKWLKNHKTDEKKPVAKTKKTKGKKVPIKTGE